MAKRIITLFNAKTAAGNGDNLRSIEGTKTYQLSGLTTAGAGTASAKVWGSNDKGSSFDLIGQIDVTLSSVRGSALSSDGFISDDTYEIIRGELVSITGTGATVDLICSVFRGDTQ